jgi:hypothetical protein
MEIEIGTKGAVDLASYDSSPVLLQTVTGTVAQFVAALYALFPTWTESLLVVRKGV